MMTIKVVARASSELKWYLIVRRIADELGLPPTATGWSPPRGRTWPGTPGEAGTGPRGQEVHHGLLQLQRQLLERKRLRAHKTKFTQAVNADDDNKDDDDDGDGGVYIKRAFVEAAPPDDIVALAGGDVFRRMNRPPVVNDGPACSVVVGLRGPCRCV